MKYAVFTAMLPDWSLHEAAAKLARLGYGGVTWRVAIPPTPDSLKDIPQEKRSLHRYWVNNQCTIDSETLPEAAGEIKSITESAGLAVCSLGTHVGCHQPLAVETMMQAAREMGAPRIRVDAPLYDGSQNYRDLFAEASEQYRDIESLAQKYGVAACVETQRGHITASASLAYRFVSQFDPKYVGVMFNPGNTVYEGYKHWRMGFDLLGPYLHEVHAKNAIWSPIDKLPSSVMNFIQPTDEQRKDGTTLWAPHFSTIRGGHANWQQIMEDLDAVGYNGWIVFEDFSGHDGDVEELCAQNLAYLKGYER